MSVSNHSKSQIHSPKRDNTSHFDEQDHLVNRFRGVSQKFYNLDKVIHNDHFRMSDLGSFTKKNSFIKLDPGQRRLTHSRPKEGSKDERRSDYVTLRKLSKTNIDTIYEEETKDNNKEINQINQSDCVPEETN